ncbi:MAG: NAD(P)-dependent oxidoreductase [Bacteroidota bacterium]
MKIIFLDAATLGDVPNWDMLEDLGEYTAYDFTAPEQVVERLRAAQVAITNKVVLDAALIEQLPELKLICVAATGTDNVDKERAEQLGIAVRNVSNYSTNAVAQLTMTALFALDYDLIHLNQAVYDGTYSRSPSFSYWRQDFYELCGARFGIIGLGTIGGRVAELAEAYGARVCYYSTSDQERSDDYERVSLDDILEHCEVISIHAPLYKRSENLIAWPQLQQMRPTAYLLNFGRGGIVNEADLARAIDEEEIAGAAVDVYQREPIPEDHPYLRVKHKNRLLLTPHVGWASVEARMRLVEGIAKNIEQGW